MLTNREKRILVVRAVPKLLVKDIEKLIAHQTMEQTKSNRILLYLSVKYPENRINRALVSL